ncbi:MAG: diguanylate cyclase [Gammaproteobacteria bacterium]|nr:diguanylate cyclase [Gammaproteobacteria bacterium]
MQNILIYGLALDQQSHWLQALANCGFNLNEMTFYFENRFKKIKQHSNSIQFDHVFLLDSSTSSINTSDVATLFPEHDIHYLDNNSDGDQLDSFLKNFIQTKQNTSQSLLNFPKLCNHLLEQNKQTTGTLQHILSKIQQAVFIFNSNILFSNALAKKIQPSLPDNFQQLLASQQPSINLDIDNNFIKIPVSYYSITWNNQPANLCIFNPLHSYSTNYTHQHNRLDALLNEYGEAELQENENQIRLDLLLKSAGEGYWDWYIPDAKVFFSPRWKNMLGYHENELPSTFNTWINLIHPSDLGKFLLVWTDYMDNNDTFFSIEYRICHKDGSYVWYEARGFKDNDELGNPVRIAGSHIDISQRKHAEQELLDYQQNLEAIIAQRTKELQNANQELEQQAMRDPLTGIANRRHMDEYLAQEFHRAAREHTTLSLIMLDIDHFKAYNDNYGHQQGDHCVQQVAHCIEQSMLRPTDMVARYGGEEFLVLLPGTNLTGAITVAKTICKNISRLETIKQCPINNKPMSLSVGLISCDTDHNTNPEYWIKQADEALYKAKENGRDQICYYRNGIIMTA